ncbi:hypothetical protein BKA67DRAFT_655668 [Truncatella angustata]|uniref:Uncharacterized protein n=1 Tax=Truncatella angustata TaxID=152316 RepID=A0A9P9A0S7_9PEZI|nr:uncharacterized protein BKA67DRAFT_655668 [Truncatella angustata]KAH6657394.1 hypothetical protein BKA67DRAFT_655668 [Truncatella angustata]
MQRMKAILRVRFRSRSHEKNTRRFGGTQAGAAAASNRIARQAFVLRAWQGYEYKDAQMLSIRAMVNELSLKSGAEYDVHLLVEIKNLSLPIWSSHSSITGVFRSGHWPVQWFSQEHPEYKFFWNWEMDVRYTGHYYELANAISKWSDKQPRKGLWERSSKFYIPSVHGTWSKFVDIVGLAAYPEGVFPPTTYEKDNYEWGVGEPADLITFNPIFDVAKSTWLHASDVTGYSTKLELPPRRCSVVAVTRMSKRLLGIMYEETWSKRHSMFPEVFPPSIALHYGLKAVYPPLPVHLDRAWNLEWLNRVFNWPTNEKESVFSFFDNAAPGFGEFNHLGSTFYFLAQFGSSLWRRWIGANEGGIGGQEWEAENGGTMCLRGALIHPVKNDGL